MNQRNVDALDELINDFEGAPSKYGGTLPQFLASRGVLVPSALTEGNAWEVGESVDGMTMTSEEARAWVVSMLERFAKGETSMKEEEING